MYTHIFLSITSIYFFACCRRLGKVSDKWMHTRKKINMNRNNDIISCMCSPYSDWRIMKCSSSAFGFVSSASSTLCRRMFYERVRILIRLFIWNLSCCQLLWASAHDWYTLVSFTNAAFSCNFLLLQWIIAHVNQRHRCWFVIFGFGLWIHHRLVWRVSLTRFKESQKPFKLFLSFTPAFRLAPRK